jgi:hypothetical protein
MSIRARIFFVIIGMVILLLVIEYVRTRRLKEQFAILWIMLATGLVLLPIAIEPINWIAQITGTDYPPALLFSLGFFAMFLILIQFSIAISKLSEDAKVITQDLALLRNRLKELEQQATPGEGTQAKG